MFCNTCYFIEKSVVDLITLIVQRGYTASCCQTNSNDDSTSTTLAGRLIKTVLKAVMSR